VTLLSLASVWFTACGVSSPPLPPERPGRVNAAQLTATQRGAQIIVKWSIPPARRTGVKLQRIDIYRLAEPRTPGASTTTLDSFREGASIVGFIPLSGTANGDQTFIDTVDLSKATRLNDTRFLYSVVYINQEGQPLGFSDLTAIEPVTVIPDAPTDLRVMPSQEQLTVTWQAPAKNIDNTAPTEISGFNVYRSDSTTKGVLRPLNATPITGTEYNDHAFEFGTEYTYTVRAITTVRGNQLESADSHPVTIKPVDIYPPAAPTSVTIASANGTISLFWPSNTEPDVVGYNVYRAESANTPDGQWIKLNGRLLPHPPTSFTDDRVQIGKRYYYKLTAVDRFGNESQRSEAVSEQVNP